jgi:hypothetical protein
MAPNQIHQRMATHETHQAPSLDFPPPESPMFLPSEKSVTLIASDARERPLWIDHVMQGIPLPSRDTHVPESGGLGRW